MYQFNRADLLAQRRGAQTLSVLRTLALLSLLILFTAVSISLAATQGANITNHTTDLHIHHSAISPDSQYVVYQTAVGASGHNLYSVPLAGGPPLKLNGTLGETEPSGLEITADSTRVLYYAIPPTGNARRVYSVPITGGDAVEISDLPQTGSVEYFELTPNGAHVVYTAAASDDAPTKVYSVSVTGGGATQISSDAHPSIFERFKMSATGEYIIYLAYRNGAADIYSARVADGDAKRLNIRPEGSDENVQLYIISPNSDYVLYSGRLTRETTRDLYTVPIEGGDSIRLTGELPAYRGAKNYTAFTNDSQHIIFAADPNTKNFDELFMVSSTGGALTPLGNDEGDGAGVEDMRTSPTAPYLVYRSDFESAGTLQLYLLNWETNMSRRLNLPLAEGHYVRNYRFTPDGQHILFTVRDASGDKGIFSAPVVDGSTVQLNTGDEYRLISHIETINQQHVFYQTRPDDSAFKNYIIYRVPIGGGTSTAINTPDEARDPGHFNVSPDGSYIVYSVYTTEAREDLFKTQRESPLSVSLTAATVEVAEGAGTITLTARLNRPSTASISVSYEVTNITTTAADHSLTDGTLVFPPNTTEQTIAVSVVDDSLDEDDETLRVSLAASADAALDGQTETLITIIDNDDPPTNGGPTEPTLTYLYIPAVMR